MDIEYLAFDSASELKEYLRRQNEFEIVLLGEDSVVINSATAIIFDKYNLIIGLLTEGCLIPKCKVIDNTIFIGYNNEVDSVREGNVVNKAIYDSLFYEFVDVTNIQKNVIAIFELGVVCLDTKGMITWEYYTHDIITDYKICEDRILIITDESSSEIMLISGKELGK